LARGDRVAASARTAGAFEAFEARFGDAFLPLQFDITDRDATFAAIHDAHRTFGRLDVVAPVAGYGLMAAIEEAEIEQVRANFETNVVGTLSVLQASIPLLRQQGRGHILAVSSVVGLISRPMMGVYCAAKFAVEALAEAAALEVAEFGIRVTIIEPGAFKTDFMGGSLQSAPPLPQYQAARESLIRRLSPDMMGDASATIPAIMQVVDCEAPPLRLILGAATPMIEGIYQERLDGWAAWRDVADAAQGSQPARPLA
jgi:NAD(P)-dependent dehydrogenase (short-subunit alcohol dehydrogenase family)